MRERRRSPGTQFVSGREKKTITLTRERVSDSRVSWQFDLMELKLVLSIPFAFPALRVERKYGLTFLLFQWSSCSLIAGAFAAFSEGTVTSELTAISGSSRFATNQAIVTAEL